MSLSSRFVHASLIALALLAPARASRAGAPGKAAPQNPAKEHFDSAQALYDQKKYDTALLLFRQVYTETKSPNARVMIGQCLLALGRTAEAYDELSAAMREAAAKAETEPKYEKTRDGAAAEVAKLETKIGKLVLTFAGQAPGARVTVNGTPVPPEKLGAPMAVAPGSVEIVAEGLGPSALKRVETINAGETRTIVLGETAAPKQTPSATVTATATSAPSAAPTTAPSAGVPGEKTGGAVRTAGFVVAGLGVAGMALFGAGFALADDKLAQLKKDCGTTRCTDPKYDSVIDSGKTFELLQNIGLGVGIAGLVGGTAMIVFGGPKAAASPGGSPAATIEIAPYGAGLRVRGSF